MDTPNFFAIDQHFIFAFAIPSKILENVQIFRTSKRKYLWQQKKNLNCFKKILWQSLE